ncbi:hypothetical protein D3C73_185020 [compost metagenome]
MAKYKRISSSIVEATQFDFGMEDGVLAYELFSNIFIGKFGKGEPYPKVSLRPYHYNHLGQSEYFNWGDYLVKNENGIMQWVRKNDFEREYELMETE